jgi:hypothetical protein
LYHDIPLNVADCKKTQAVKKKKTKTKTKTKMSLTWLFYTGKTIHKFGA